MTTLASFDAARPLLLASDYPPDTAGGGAVILRSLLDGPARSSVVWASPLGQEPAGPGQASLAAWRVELPLLHRRSLVVDSLFAGRLAGGLMTLARQLQAPALWIVLHGSMVHVAARLLAEKTLPVHVTVHDDPAFGVALLSRRYLPLLPLIERDFAYALRRADSVDVVSEGMATRYRRRYGVSATVVHRGLPGPIAARGDYAADGVLDVGIIGNTYGYAQLPVLAQAVRRTAQLVGCRGRVTIIGRGLGERLRSEAGAGLDVEVAGHLDENAAIERLSRCFALYLNYPFSRRSAVLRSTSFPTKLSSYLLAARPLLLHVPADSSVAGLACRPGYVGWWRTERPEDGTNVLTELWRTPAAHRSQHGAAEELRREHYDLETNRRTLFRALDALAVR